MTPRGSDLLAVLAVLLCGLVPFPDELFRVRGLLLIIALLPVVLLPFRRRFPIAALGLSLACTVALALAGFLSPSGLLAVSISAFSVTERRPRRVGIPVVAAAVLIVFFVNPIPLGGEFFDSRAMQFLTFIILAAALGDTTRSRKKYLAAVTERAERAERSREEEARSRVAEERVRIARDLHDLIAHQIAVISLSAGVATSALESRPDRAREALTAIRSASRTVLADIGALLALLRSEDPERRGTLAPQAGLSALDDLVKSFGEVGLRVHVERAAESEALSPATDLVAYLALQEGLTNAHKHGVHGRASIRISILEKSLHLRISNPVPEHPADPIPGGHGLRGLRERVAAVRGRVETGVADGEFRLNIVLPREDGTPA